MRFFLDENLPATLREPLSAVYYDHDFVSGHGTDLVGEPDLALFPALAARGYDALVTQDKAQLSDEDERRALYDAGLHWVGLSMKSHKGLRGIALMSAAVVAGVSYVLDDWRSEPHAYRLRGVESEASQRVKCEAVRLSSWTV
ncbi:hypothetical protein [Cellulomonas cellasea]|uniref:VapC45 PIN like domain-containing protein n=1 Tax=Cellulomonas cellasea TaxID=43670 RepID=A0A7W4Y948_9CELL|nr:hypothetical protein [Cellulomonas cellasea]MBB2921280.1 hypothetical protein [Cellulomonas cellasea]